MRIATMATGGIGGYLAVKLTKVGHEVATIARGSHLEAIKSNGLKLQRNNEIETIKPWIVSSDTKQIGPVDVIIFGVKCHALEKAAQACTPMLKDTTVVIPFLNGVEAATRLLEILPKKNVANGVAKISTTVSEPGIITQVGDFAQFIFSEMNSKSSSRIAHLQEVFRRAGVDAPKTDDITRDLWSKFVLFTAISGTTSAARCTIGDILGSAELSKLCQDIMRETAILGRRTGISLPTSLEDNLWLSITKLPANMRASTAIDLENNRPLEIKWLSGAVVRLAEETGVSVPLNQTIYSLLSIYQNGKT